MTQKTLEKLNQKISYLNEEIKTLRSFVIGALIKDKEGEYKPKFVKKILGLSKGEAEFIFKDADTFLKKIQKKV